MLGLTSHRTFHLKWTFPKLYQWDLEGFSDIVKLHEVELVIQLTAADPIVGHKS